MFSEEQSIINARNTESSLKIEAQKTVIKTLRRQIDILKSKCF